MIGGIGLKQRVGLGDRGSPLGGFGGGGGRVVL